LAAIMKASEHCFIVKYMNVLVQAGISMCGIFLIAYATAWCSKKSFTHFSFDNTVMK